MELGRPSGMIISCLPANRKVMGKQVRCFLYILIRFGDCEPRVRVLRKGGILLQNLSPSRDSGFRRDGFSFNVSLSAGRRTPLLYDLTTPPKRDDSCTV
ncbi:hypothetical protein AVEN_161947-1 [Araneus ventricosus]|uniref:Uncharacterized protein n=1 Tax=Araneus ventricosus TaxID=182803 RepID=A0A4Y2A9G7_ARAVE|nr:hypothetical protein AVEN_161947-1 [Araneus ventricosus]